ncbi:hypothetical protein [Pseudomonas aeruginosa]|uniref:hypothetical protein n=1 Tax=Pseudomonas aeruginosa TaxID=287 RepID=UPI000D372C17|nr:hypothetical protein [Pseudomonas aeruginosa]MBX6046731.1 hypothetical protein [Pseudomonas aeruginosa]MYM47947.1 hypothetical protein [Pseudomonas aeruginosa]PTZ08066.1 hypothetical protein DB396_17170 [Pseudomonas aeruginosa]HBP6412299.1 hypothetical protein [Pseudomonas aeruginosa]HEK0047248.1 hypothetical protein [Pseudomonas aeruginosa]
MKQTFEYHIENIDIPYQAPLQSVSLLGRQRRTDKTLEPDANALLGDSLRWEKVQLLGQEGWELVSVQPLMRSVTEIGNQNAQGWAWGVALPVSYLLFFKRATS